MQELDKIGRDKFLDKYEFGRARTYFVIHDGKMYDCKPLLWTAYQYQFGVQLLERATGGVNKTVRPHIEKLGFTVVVANESLEDIKIDIYARVSESQQLPHEERLKRLESAPSKPKIIKVPTFVFFRNVDVVAERLFLANGVCESCGCPAPFLRAKDGAPYLEVHHIKKLADGGDDAVENTTALCPNCHRKMHYGRKNG